MKSAKTTLKAKKLSIKKDTLRTLSESDLSRVDGAYSTGTCIYMVSRNTAWCSSYPNTKCQA